MRDALAHLPPLPWHDILVYCVGFVGGYLARSAFQTWRNRQTDVNRVADKVTDRGVESVVQHDIDKVLTRGALRGSERDHRDGGMWI